VAAPGNLHITTTKNAGKLLAILIAMRMRRYDAGHITQWSTSVASLEATGCRHWASACAILPRQQPRSSILNETTKYYQNTTIS
jgi:hypothetical protein